ncbi:MAG: polysaccharide biosynthesis protein, partial [Phycisphaerae bacterium]|nr:polysaccharide biosynthesis protein [Phycisphaerae bacterium]
MSKAETNRTEPKELSRFLMFVAKYQHSLNILCHVVIFSVALLASFLLRYDIASRTDFNTNIGTWFFGVYLPILPFFVILKLIIFGQLKLFRGGWQYSGIRDIAQILLASWLFVFIGFGCWYVFNLLPRQLEQTPIPLLTSYFGLFPRMVLLLDFLATVFLACSARLSVRIYREELRPISVEGRTRVLIIGAGNSAETIIREINRQRIERYRVIGLVDDDPRKQKMYIHEVPVLGKTDEIPEICEDNDIEELIIAMPSASQKQLREVIERCAGTKLKFQSLPGMSDLIDGRVTVSQIRPVDINDLLGRDIVELNIDSVAKFINGRVVLVTGAGGSIGSEMSRQICHYKPKQLILLEQAETPLFDIAGELKRNFPDVDTVQRICDIYDRDRVMKTWE